MHAPQALHRCTGVACNDPNGPGIGGFPSTPASRNRTSSSSNSSSVNPVVCSMTMDRSLQVHGGYLSGTHGAPRGRTITISHLENIPGHPYNNLPYIRQGK